MKGFTFLRLFDQDFAKWNAFVEMHPEGTVFHTTQWLGMINPDVEVYVGLKNDTIAGGVAMIKTKKFGLKAYHIPPYTPYSGPLVSKVEISSEFERIQFTQELLKFLPKSGHVDFGFLLKDGIFPYHWNGFSSSVTHNYTRTGSVTEYEKSLNKNKARELKKLRELIKTGELIYENGVNLSVFMNLMKETSERKSFYIRDAVLEKIIENTTFDSFSASLKTSEGKYLSAVYLIQGNNRLYNLFNVSIKIDHPIYKTSNLILIDEAIRYALNHGLAFDFEGSMLKGVEHFYRLMGGEIEHKVRLQKTGSIRYSILKYLSELKRAGITSW